MSARVDLTWIEKYATFEQAASGRLTPTDCHFLAEVCYRDAAQLQGLTASLHADRAGGRIATYDALDPRAFTNGYFYTRKSKSYDSLAELEAAHPAGDSYHWELDDGRDRLRLAPVRIGGPAARTAIPAPSPIFLSQDGGPVEHPPRVRPDRPLTIAWRPFVTGAARPGTVWQDLIFALVSDADGQVVYTGGVPGSDAGFLDYTTTATEVPAATLEEGSAYVVFISQVKWVDHNVSNGIEQLAANSFAVELPVTTVGASRARAAPVRRAPYLWSGKTPRDLGMVPWPGFRS
jgi:hypothetical protein